ncbi:MULTISPECIES: nuclear transport factor 2 family protein [unclassified Colwellia]|uniref:nuclear transport factor 2 family protein n=1 Tax=unclassified Colwellia TaxID=196834 RepID=UPI0015F59485|nr:MULTISPECIES: nuclear transport factor 2 family protein [unclassified Colwellia]MBA6354980.1 nuclear transport factor 2 family protein [Colwellia sp. BRX8-3]MBA6359867.1 nuclear transport factor 2 family protein [Colwellia sp. BRX8-6]MBA6366882.1 nuclear transport factor 2 family protein [Colwellia sp. BRX8-5]MBA6373884.1 nuclear transport factor 2 family protein [Colwellia sp. BRX8-2]
MNNKNLLILILTLSVSVNLLANEAVFRPVETLFSAMSAADHIKMKAVVTDDFQLLEAGEDWSLTDLINVVKPSEYKRRNYFSVIKTRVYSDVAWVSYWNKATFNNGKEESTVAWLESAVMVKVAGQWKMQMLHSTRIKAESIPKDILLSEYVD